MNLSIVLNLTNAILVSVFLPYVIKIVSMLEPFEQKTGHFIFSGNIENVSLALDLLHKELDLALTSLYDYGETALKTRSLEEFTNQNKIIHEKFHNEYEKIKNYSINLIDQGVVSIEEYKKFNSFFFTQQLVNSFEKSMYKWSQTIGELIITHPSHMILLNQAEAWNAIFQEALDALHRKDIDTMRDSIELINDKTEIMAGLREYWNTIMGDNPRDQNLFLIATQSFEVNNWLLRNIVSNSLKQVTVEGVAMRKQPDPYPQV